MGFFKDFKDDLSEAANGMDAGINNKDIGVENSDDQIVNTLDDDIHNSAQNENSTSQEDYSSNESEQDVHAMEQVDEPEEDDLMPVDETAVITAGLRVEGNFEALGSIDVFGTIIGDINCRGKLTVSGTIKGASNAGEVFANEARIEGDIVAKGAVKIGQDTVIVGDISGTSAVIAGAVKGDIDVKGPVIIDSTAIVSGDIKSKTVQINNGATIDGRCTQCYSEIDMDAIFNI